MTTLVYGGIHKLCQVFFKEFWIQIGGKLNFRPILSIWISNISKTLKALVYEGFLIQNGGKSISDQFCPNGFFKNFDMTSMSKRLDIF